PLSADSLPRWNTHVRYEADLIQMVAELGVVEADQLGEDSQVFWAGREHMKYGSARGGDDAEPKAQCVQCGLTLSSEALKPSKLKRHIETKHPQRWVEKPLEYLQRKHDGLQLQKQTVVSLSTQSKTVLKTSYLVARRVVQRKKAFTIAEELVLPAAADMCREMIGEATARKLSQVPLSNDTVNRQIAEMGSDIHTFVRYLWGACSHEDLLFCVELPTRTAGNGPEWKNCVGICSDGCRPHQWREDTQVMRNGHAVFCIAESLASKKMSPQLREVMNVAVKTVNYIEKSAVNAMCFSVLCEGMDSGHGQLLCHSEVKWLSRHEAQCFLAVKKSSLANNYADVTFLPQLAYTADIFAQLNQLNLSIQGKNSNIFLVADKIEGFKRKLSLWAKRVQEERMEMFWKTLHMWLAEKFVENFPDDTSGGNMWMLDPFSVDPQADDIVLPTELEEQLMELSADNTSKEYPGLALTAVQFLLTITTKYLCESGFSTVTTTKTKARNGLMASLEAYLRVSLSSIPPRLDLLVSQRQTQASHRL
uniref:BED-type domain-containing protein n=1 Tax=Paramormyrops kingsleyae TaxID=1676925 RepID=A0A3B3SP63_9TELE